MHPVALGVLVISLVAGAGKPAARAVKHPARTAAHGSSATPARSTPGPAAAGPAAHERTRVAVLELSGLGITDITKNLEQYLRNIIANIAGFQVLSAVDVQMALQDPKNRAVAACEGGIECALETGKLVGADVVIIGSITGLGDAFSLNLRALDVGRARELARYQASVSGRDRLIPETRLAAYRLVAPGEIRGSLVVDIDVSGALVVLDGKPVGTTPLAGPVEDLAPGPHQVRVERPGYEPFLQSLTIRPFEATRLELTLEQASR